MNTTKIIEMNRRIFIVLILLFIISPVFAGDKGRKYFTDQDLKKYKESTDTKVSLSFESADIVSGFKDNSRDAESEEQKPKKYVIPYSGSARRIIIPVTFNGRTTAPMLLDTGATGMHISLKLAKKLDILNNDKARLLFTVVGVGGAIPAIFTILDSIKIGDVEYDFIPTTISFSNFRKFDGLIGMDFMTNYSVYIDTKKRKVVFEELPESSSMPAGRNKTWWRYTFRTFKLMRSSWSNYREKLYVQKPDSLRLREQRMFADWQYKKAEDLYDRLNVYASEHSVPLEWR